MKVHDDVKMKNNCIFLKMCRYTLVYSVLVTVGYLTVKYALTSTKPNPIVNATYLSVPP